MGTLVCTVTLDKNAGITVEVDNSSGNITQKITMDGTAITLTVIGQQQTSTIVQKCDSIVVTCKDLTLDTETITFKSSKASNWTSQDVLNLNSTKDMTFNSQAGLTETATKDVQISGQNATIKAQSQLEGDGATVKIAASTGDANISGATLTMKGTTQAQLSSAAVKVSATGQLDLEGTGIANLKGGMTNVKGSLISLG
jgi:hypothetical protein